MSIQKAAKLFAAGDLESARICCKNLLARQADDTNALNLLGLIALRSGEFSTSVDLLSRAIEIEPDRPEFYANLAAALAQLQRLPQAIDAARKAISLCPSYVTAWQNLAQLLKLVGRPAEAEEAARRWIELSPNDADGLNCLALSLHVQERFEEAEGACRRAMELAPNSGAAWSTLGMIRQEQGRIEQSRANFAKSVALSPQSASAHYNYGIALLLSGDLRAGWEEYEWRFRGPPARAWPAQDSKPLWDGRDLSGRTILLQAEQGLGDTIQFIRYAPLVARRGAKVVVASQPPLQRLLQSVEGVSRVIAVDQSPPPFDLHLPLGSLPRVFGTDLTTIPADVPYIRPESSSISKWSSRISASGFRVGLCWAGSPLHSNDRNRSIDPRLLLPLLNAPNVTFFSLQKDRGVGDETPLRSSLIDWTAELQDMADTAGLIANLHMVISVDTSVAHLAGAMGKPAWVLLPFAPDWRWMRDRDDSPWYPHLRLFRQRQRGNWERVIELVAEQLKEAAR